MDFKNKLNITYADFEKGICDLDKGYKVDKTDDSIFITYKGQDILRVSLKVKFVFRKMGNFKECPKKEDAYYISSLLSATPLDKRE